MRRKSSFIAALVCALFAATVVTAATEPAAPTKPAATKTPPASKPATTKPAATKPGATKTPTTTRAKTPAKAAAKPKPKTNELQQIDWRELLPENERKKYNPNAPAPIHGPLGEGGPPAVQTVTTTVNEELDQALVRMPGFIVPLGPPDRKSVV